MAAKTPVTQGTTGFPGIDGVFGGVNAVDAELLSNGTLHASVAGFKFRRKYFANIDDTDTWTSAQPGIIGVAWQPNQADTDLVGASLTTAATGIVTFSATNADSKGWLWVISRN